MGIKFSAADHIGRKESFLTVVDYLEEGGSTVNHTWFVCECECGNKTSVRANHILYGRGTKSCGCRRRMSWKSRGIDRSRIPAVDFCVNQIVAVYRSRCKRLGITWELSEEEVRALLFSDCSYCGSPPKNKKTVKHRNESFRYSGIDKVDNRLGYTTDNVRSCCIDCNVSKNDRTEDEFLDWIESVYEVSCKDRKKKKFKILKGA